MKKFAGVILVLLVLTSFSGIKDCDGFKSCPVDLSQYSLVKSYRLSLESNKYVEPKARFSIMLSKGVRYRIGVCSNRDYSKSPLTFTLFDNYGEVASNIDEDKGKFFEAAEYECKKTGVYYITFAFANGKSGCGAANISIKK